MTDLIHEGTKTFAGGQGPGRILAEIYVTVGFWVALLMISKDAPCWLPWRWRWAPPYSSSRCLPTSHATGSQPT